MTNEFEPKTVTSHPNIALIKYWGKSDIKENLPTNESISLTLKNLITTTTIEESSEDLFILDNEIKEIPVRMQNLINYFKEVSNYKDKLKIVSNNSFPHSCGLASSASGYSALVKALDSFFNLNLDSKTLSILARKGSGSASRSIFDGLVHLKKEGKEYFAEKLGEWKELRVILLVLNKNSKKVPSTEGMLRTVNTSELFKKRLENINKKIKDMIHYIHTKNFKELAILTMKDSNEIHATCLDSFPPIFYLTDQSRNVIEDVFEINKNEVKVGYTFDAGANAFLITLDCYFEEIKSKFEKKYEIITAL